MNPLGLEIKVKIPEDLLDFLELNEADKADMQKTIADQAADFWKTAAAETLQASAVEHYIDAITVEQDSQGYKVVLGNAGQKPNLAVAVELGSESFDMKPGFLKFAYARRTMPLWRGTPGMAEQPRTVAWSSPGWIHPGIEAKGLRQFVEDEIMDILIEDAVNAWWDRIA